MGMGFEHCEVGFRKKGMGNGTGTLPLQDPPERTLKFLAITVSLAKPPKDLKSGRYIDYSCTKLNINYNERKEFPRYYLHFKDSLGVHSK